MVMEITTPTKKKSAFMTQAMAQKWNVLHATIHMAYLPMGPAHDLTRVSYEWITESPVLILVQPASLAMVQAHFA